MLSVAQPAPAINEEKLNMEDKQNIGQALGRIASGIFVVTTERNGQRDGLLASWINQAAFDPPMVSVAVQKQRHLLELLAVGARFTINILGKSSNDVFKNFAKPYKEGLDRFAGLDLLPNAKAGPILANSAAFLDCVTRTIVEAGDHALVIGEVIAGGPIQQDAEPMVHLRKNGFQY